MLLQDYGVMVARLTKSGAEIAAEMTPGDAHLLHMAVGVSGEAGELLDAIKKSVVYRRTLNLQNVIEELGDLEFYMEGLRNYIGISRDDVLLFNMGKLRARYAEQTYSNEAAQARADKEPGQ